MTLLASFHKVHPGPLVQARQPVENQKGAKLMRRSDIDEAGVFVPLCIRYKQAAVRGPAKMQPNILFSYSAV